MHDGVHGAEQRDKKLSFHLRLCYLTAVTTERGGEGTLMHHSCDFFETLWDPRHVLPESSSREPICGASAVLQIGVMYLSHLSIISAMFLCSRLPQLHLRRALFLLVLLQQTAYPHRKIYYPTACFLVRWFLQHMLKL